MVRDRWPLTSLGGKFKWSLLLSLASPLLPNLSLLLWRSLSDGSSLALWLYRSIACLSVCLFSTLPPSPSRSFPPSLTLYFSSLLSFPLSLSLSSPFLSLSLPSFPLSLPPVLSSLSPSPIVRSGERRAVPNQEKKSADECKAFRIGFAKLLQHAKIPSRGCK